MIRKAIFFLLITFLTGWCHVAWSQAQMLEQKITIHLDDVRLEEALNRISEAGNINFSYSSKIIPIDEIVTIHADNEPIRSILDNAFKDPGIAYSVIEGKVILRRRVETTETIEEEQSKPKSKNTIRGYIRDQENGESLIGASIYIEELNNGTITNPYGFYSVTLPKGEYSFKVRYIGYKTKTIDVDLSQNTTLDLSLETQPALLEEIVITSIDSIDLIQNLKFTSSSLQPETVKEQPSLMGEYDVIKSLETLPGVQFFRDGSTFFHVRGGHYDQNQILLDEAPIYNPSHMLGLFGTFIPEAVQHVKLYKGDFPAEMGGRISSVVDIKTKEGNQKSFGLHGSLGLLSTRVAVEGPIIKDKASFFVSARRSHIKAYANAVDPDISDLHFFDINTKVNFQFNENNRLFGSFYLGEDKYFQNEENGIRWSNKAATIRWNHVFNEKLFANTTIYSSNYEYDLITSATNHQQWQSYIANLSLKSDFTLYANPSNTIKYGLKISGHEFNPGNFVDASGETPVGVSSVPSRNAAEATVYASHEKQFSDKWLVDYGLRFSSWHNTGNTIEYTYDDAYDVVDSVTHTGDGAYHSYTTLEPRFELVYNPSERSFFKLNYTRAAQYINLMSNSISPFSSLEVWVPAGPNIKPQIADQFSLGWFTSVFNSKLNLSLEGYYKLMKNQVGYVDHANLFLNPHYEGEIRTGKGKAYGVEAMLKKDYGRFRGKLAYTYSRSLKTIDGLNEGREYPALWDRPHQFTLNALWSLSEKSSLSGNLTMSTGAPVTTPVAFYYYQGRSVPVYDERNNDRMPTYHRFDVAYTLQLNKPGRKYEHSLTFSIFNLYGRRNNVLENFNKIIDENGDPLVPTDVENDNALTPTKFYVYDVIPSITYNFSL